MQSALVLQHPEGRGVARSRAWPTRVRHLNPTLVLSPALGGLIIGHEVARALGVRAMFAERAGGTALTLRRGFAMTSADRVLVVEDVFTTGKSTRETMEVAREAGAQVVGAAAIVDRSGGTIDFGVPSYALVNLAVPTYEAEKCPLCAQGTPVEKPGSRPLIGVLGSWVLGSGVPWLQAWRSIQNAVFCRWTLSCVMAPQRTANREPVGNLEPGTGTWNLEPGT